MRVTKPASSCAFCATRGGREGTTSIMNSEGGRDGLVCDLQTLYKHKRTEPGDKGLDSYMDGVRRLFKAELKIATTHSPRVQALGEAFDEAYETPPQTSCVTEGTSLSFSVPQNPLCTVEIIPLPCLTGGKSISVRCPDTAINQPR